MPYEMVKDDPRFLCSFEKMNVKGKGEMDTWFVSRNGLFIKLDVMNEIGEMNKTFKIDEVAKTARQVSLKKKGKRFGPRKSKRLLRDSSAVEDFPTVAEANAQERESKKVFISTSLKFGGENNLRVTADFENAQVDSRVQSGTRSVLMICTYMLIRSIWYDIWAAHESTMSVCSGCDAAIRYKTEDVELVQGMKKEAYVHNLIRLRYSVLLPFFRRLVLFESTWCISV